jgi:peptidoglycan/LPS O-acetylase OafA/YrhL
MFIFQVSLFIPVVVLSYILAVPLYLFVELPVIELWRALAMNLRKKDEKPDKTSPPEAVKQPPQDV